MFNLQIPFKLMNQSQLRDGEMYIFIRSPPMLWNPYSEREMDGGDIFTNPVNFPAPVSPFNTWTDFLCVWIVFYLLANIIRSCC